MKLNNKGFALTSIIYMLIVLFLMIMLLILANLAQRKVVLDKIKEDVKISLNQGGQLSQNTYTVTFDPTIGQINQTTKQVTYNEPYGELPTPTREGYKFVGWRGKNMFDSEKTELGYIDDADGTLKDPQNGRNSSNFIEIESDIDYTISPIISSGKWGAFYDQDKHFISGFIYRDGVIHSPSNAKYIRFTVNYQDSNANYSTTTQLEEGDTATSYEPYQEYTSDTIVTKQENHTLYAMWEPYYTVSFDTNGGTISQNTKQVLYNETYGELPAPTREGYKFIGWRGKNAFNPSDFYEIGKNYHVGIENNSILLSQYPYQEQYTKMNLHLKNNTQYTLSYNWLVTKISSGDRIRSGLSFTYDDDTYENLSASRVGGALNDTGFKTLTSNGSKTISSIRSAGWEWTGTIKLSNIQIEEGTEATQYEPYQEYTSDTIVTKQENHTLYAIWNDIPQLTLSKETYVEVPFDNTWTYSNATVDDNVLTLGANGNNSSATTGFINVNNEYWYVTMDGYTETTLPDKDKNGIHFTMYYYDSNQTATNALSGSTNNGSALNLEVGSWQNNLEYNHPDYNRYGPTVNYVKLAFRSDYSSTYSKPPIKLRNLKVYGQMPNSFYLINVTATDSDGIEIIKYAKGQQNIDYFKNNGTTVENNQARVTENGTYTVYVRDTKGAETIETIEITNIQ